MNIYPYVYRGTHRTTGEFYIGLRYANKVRPEADLGSVYKTSSKIVQPIFNEFEWVVLAEFFSIDAAREFEVLEIKNHINDELCLNQAAFPVCLNTAHTVDSMGEDKHALWTRRLSAAKKGVAKSEAHKKSQSISRLGIKRGRYNRQVKNPICSCIVCRKRICNNNITHHFNTHYQ